ncbi:MAG: transposase [Frankiales bacterium]|nr:transposase [Frankiales bacterium]
MIADAVLLLAGLTSTAVACALLGKARASHYRDRAPVPVVPAQRSPRPSPPNALTTTEQDEIISVLTSPRFCDKSVAQTWATLLDEGTYLASMSTMHRLLRLIGQSGDRREQATHPARARPELMATGPGQVWSWDITKLRGPTRGVYYDLYVILDIYSRYVVGWTVAAREDSTIAAELIATAARVHGAPASLHADRGTSMTSKPVAQLLVDLGVARSHSRPHVSNDNPFSEAAFKTLKYAPAFPGNFGSLPDARAFCEAFFGYYNHEHRHSGIGLHTPASVHHGTADQVRQQRRQTLHAAYAANPGRFRHRRPEPAHAACRRLDQPAQPGGPHPEQLTPNCLKPLDTFRIATALFVGLCLGELLALTVANVNLVSIERQDDVARKWSCWIGRRCQALPTLFGSRDREASSALVSTPVGTAGPATTRRRSAELRTEAAARDVS